MKKNLTYFKKIFLLIFLFQSSYSADFTLEQIRQYLEFIPKELINIVLEYTNDSSIEVHIINLSYDFNYTIIAKSTETILDLKKKFHDLMDPHKKNYYYKTPESIELSLEYNGQEFLDNTKTLEQYDIKNLTTIYQTSRIRNYSDYE